MPPSPATHTRPGRADSLVQTRKQAIELYPLFPEPADGFPGPRRLLLLQGFACWGWVRPGSLPLGRALPHGDRAKTTGRPHPAAHGTTRGLVLISGSVEQHALPLRYSNPASGVFGLPQLWVLETWAESE